MDNNDDNQAGWEWCDDIQRELAEYEEHHNDVVYKLDFDPLDNETFEDVINQATQSTK